MMLSLTMFDTLGHTFLLKPLLIAEKAMEYYTSRYGYEYHFVIPRDEFRSLRTTFQKDVMTNAFGDVGIEVGGYMFYESQFGFTYFHLERDAVDRQDYLVAHPAILLFLSIMRLVQEPTMKTVQADMLLLLYKMGVLVADSSEPPTTSNEALPALSQQAPWAPIEEVPLTRLENSVALVLKDHGCLIQVGSGGSCRVRFPASTRSTPFPPIGPINRFRIMLSDGLDLRHDYDSPRTMSILYLADPEAQNTRKESSAPPGAQ